MLVRYYYAEENRHGKGAFTTYISRGREVICSLGELYRFPDKEARNRWVADAPWRDGKQVHREMLAANRAIFIHVTGELRRADWENVGVYDGFDYDRFIAPESRYA